MAGRRERIATGDEVLLALTRILRGEIEAKPAEVLRAAEMLGKRYGLFAEQQEQGKMAVIVDDMGNGTSGQRGGEDQ